MKTILGITVTTEQAEEFFYNALCNGLGYVCGYGLSIDFDEAEYKLSKNSMISKAPCFEDVLMKMLKDGFKLTLVDVEGEGDNTRSITMQDVYDRMDKVPARHLLDMAEERDDADTADAILQTVFFEDIIFA